MTLSLDTLRLLRRVLAQQQLVVGDPQFAQAAQAAATALAELDEAIAGAETEPPLLTKENT